MALRARYCQDFETKVWSWFWSIFSLKTLRLNIGKFFEVEVWSRLWGRCLVEKCWHHLKTRRMRVTEANMNFVPQKIYFAALCGAFFLYWCCFLRSNTQNAAQFEQHCAYLNNISRIWETFCIEEDNLQKGNAFWGEENYISVRGKNIVGNIASETTFDHWKVGFLMSKSEKKWEKGAMKPLLRHSIGQHDLKTVARSNFRPEMA